MLSAYIDDQMKENLRNLNVQFIEKPFIPVDFIQFIRDVLI